MSDPVPLSREAAIATLWPNRPGRLNAISLAKQERPFKGG